MAIYVSENDMPKKTCENCLLCEYFEKDAHGKGKHEVACLYEGTLNNILFGDKLCPENCNIVKSLEQHDAELKAKWCDLIITILDYEIIPLGDSKEDWYVKSKFIYLQEKLEELKGE